MWNDWHRASFAGHGPVGITVIALVGDDGAGCFVESGIDQIRKQRAAGFLAACQFERDGKPVKVGLDVAPGRPTAF